MHSGASKTAISVCEGGRASGGTEKRKNGSDVILFEVKLLLVSIFEKLPIDLNA